MSFETRILAASEWERKVALWFQSRGNDVYPFGQQLLPDTARSRLRGYRREYALRWMPDLLVLGPSGALLVDAKFSNRNGWHNVENASTTSCLGWEDALGIQVTYAFPHNNDEPGFINVRDWMLVSQPGVNRGGGSGRPFHTAGCQHCQFPTDPQFFDQDAITTEGNDHGKEAK